jgi:hypothetical protein
VACLFVRLLRCSPLRFVFVVVRVGSLLLLWCFVVCVCVFVCVCVCACVCPCLFSRSLVDCLRTLLTRVGSRSSGS